MIRAARQAPADVRFALLRGRREDIRRSRVRDASCSRAAGPRGMAAPLPGGGVADVGVASRGIIPQAPVKRKRVVQLIDLRAGVGDGRWNVNPDRWLGQRQRWWG